jgi:hypothetical protein
MTSSPATRAAEAVCKAHDRLDWYHVERDERRAIVAAAIAPHFAALEAELARLGAERDEACAQLVEARAELASAREKAEAFDALEALIAAQAGSDDRDLSLGLYAGPPLAVTIYAGSALLGSGPTLAAALAAAGREA